MRKVLISVAAILAACGLEAQADAAVNYNSSKSNSGNFTLECKRLGGTASVANGQASCTLPRPSKMAVKTTGVPQNLTDACVKDGGKIVQQGGAATCKVDLSRGATTGKRTHEPIT